MHFDLNNDPSQLFIDKLYTLQRRRFKSIYLLFWKDFESDFWHEKIGSERGSIPDRSLDIVIGKRVKRIDLTDRCSIVLIEDEI